MNIFTPSTMKRNEHAHPAIRVNQALYENVVVITRKTELEELTERFNTVAQARFYLDHAGQNFDPIDASHKKYQAVLARVRQSIPRGLKTHVIERSYLPQYSFQPADLVITIGPDGLVVNAAKYVGEQPILAINPDPVHIDGILMAYHEHQMGSALSAVLAGEAKFKQVSMAEARLEDGQRLLAFNDLYIGAQSHVSARYHLAQAGLGEEQSSSGIIVSTGAGSTGWLQSVYAGAAGVIQALGGQVTPPPNAGRLPWDTEHLMYAVREPFPSKVSETNKVFGVVTKNAPLTITSHMAGNGVIFSDGTESDYLAFNAGSTATITLAKHKARLVA